MKKPKPKQSDIANYLRFLREVYGDQDNGKEKETINNNESNDSSTRKGLL